MQQNRSLDASDADFGVLSRSNENSRAGMSGDAANLGSGEAGSGEPSILERLRQGLPFPMRPSAGLAIHDRDLVRESSQMNRRVGFSGTNSFTRFHGERSQVSGRTPRFTASISHSERSASASNDNENEIPGGRRAKRRKLDVDDNRNTPCWLNYGHYGQVVPGALRMEMVACDGSASEPWSTTAQPLNVLSSDPSIYSADGDRCNITLRHPGETPFCLRKITIKIPPGRNTPVREGMVFVSMSWDELFTRTAEYKLGYRPPRENLQSRDTVLNRLVPNSGQGSHLRRRTTLFDPEVSSDTDEEYEVFCQRNQRNSSPDYQTDFQVTTNYGDKIDDDDEVNEEQQTEAVNFDNDPDETSSLTSSQCDQLETELFVPESESDSNDDASDAAPENDYYSYSRRPRRSGLGIRGVRGSLRAHLGRLGSHGRNSSVTNGGAGVGERSHPHVGGEFLKPHARFTMSRSRTMASIKFDPPV